MPNHRYQGEYISKITRNTTTPKEESETIMFQQGD